MSDAYSINDLDTLTGLYGSVNANSLAKETSQLTPTYRKWLEMAPFFALASVGPGGLDCTPRGDAEGLGLQILDDRTVVIPDRRGNNRLDTLKNIINDPRVALLFLIPGINETLRINGRARITVDPGLLDRFLYQGKKPVTAIIVDIDAVYFQCARALKRAQLWQNPSEATLQNVPTAGQMTRGALPDFDAETYDANLEARHRETLY